jgi:hypothetical protein
MIGFVVTPETAAAVLAGVEQAMDARGLPHYWSPGSFPIYTGAHAGQSFIPADDAMLATPLHGNPPLHPTDFPEFSQLVGLLGGLDARVDIDPETIAAPAE